MVKWKDLKADWHRDPKRRALVDSEFPYRLIADELIALRARIGLSQAELAARAGTTQSVIARAESGRHPVNVRSLSRVAASVGHFWRPHFEKIERGAEAVPVTSLEVPTPTYGQASRRPILVVLPGRTSRSPRRHGLVA